jgi:hypothetical protein
VRAWCAPRLPRRVTLSAAALRQLTDPQLRDLWLETDRRLRVAATPAGALRVVLDREALLDEVDRRHPAVEPGPGRRREGA